MSSSQRGASNNSRSGLPPLSSSSISEQQKSASSRRSSDRSASPVLQSSQRQSNSAAPALDMSSVQRSLPAAAIRPYMRPVSSPTPSPSSSSCSSSDSSSPRPIATWASICAPSSASSSSSPISSPAPSPSLTSSAPPVAQPSPPPVAQPPPPPSPTPPVWNQQPAPQPFPASFNSYRGRGIPPRFGRRNSADGGNFSFQQPMRGGSVARGTGMRGRGGLYGRRERSEEKSFAPRDDGVFIIGQEGNSACANPIVFPTALDPTSAIDYNKNPAFTEYYQQCFHTYLNQFQMQKRLQNQMASLARQQSHAKQFDEERDKAEAEMEREEEAAAKEDKFFNETKEETEEEVPQEEDAEVQILTSAPLAPLPPLPVYQPVIQRTSSLPTASCLSSIFLPFSLQSFPPPPPTFIPPQPPTPRRLSLPPSYHYLQLPHQLPAQQQSHHPKIRVADSLESIHPQPPTPAAPAAVEEGNRPSSAPSSGRHQRNPSDGSIDYSGSQQQPRRSTSRQPLQQSLPPRPGSSDGSSTKSEGGFRARGGGNTGNARSSNSGSNGGKSIYRNSNSNSSSSSASQSSFLPPFPPIPPPFPIPFDPSSSSSAALYSADFMSAFMHQYPMLPMPPSASGPSPSGNPLVDSQQQSMDYFMQQSFPQRYSLPPPPLPSYASSSFPPSRYSAHNSQYSIPPPPVPLPNEYQYALHFPSASHPHPIIHSSPFSSAAASMAAASFNPSSSSSSTPLVLQHAFRGKYDYVFDSLLASSSPNLSSFLQSTSPSIRCRMNSIPPSLQPTIAHFQQQLTQPPPQQQQPSSASSSSSSSPSKSKQQPASLSSELPAPRSVSPPLPAASANAPQPSPIIESSSNNNNIHEHCDTFCYDWKDLWISYDEACVFGQEIPVILPSSSASASAPAPSPASSASASAPVTTYTESTIYFVPYLAAIQLYTRANSTSKPDFEFYETAMPEVRIPLIDKIEELQKTCKNFPPMTCTCHLDLTRSWFAIHWSPIHQHTTSSHLGPSSLLTVYPFVPSLRLYDLANSKSGLLPCTDPLTTVMESPLLPDICYNVAAATLPSGMPSSAVPSPAPSSASSASRASSEENKDSSSSSSSPSDDEVEEISPPSSPCVTPSSSVSSSSSSSASSASPVQQSQQLPPVRMCLPVLGFLPNKLRFDTWFTPEYHKPNLLMDPSCNLAFRRLHPRHAPEPTAMSVSSDPSVPSVPMVNFYYGPVHLIQSAALFLKTKGVEDEGDFHHVFRVNQCIETLLYDSS